jgi:hypothetical protein
MKYLLLGVSLALASCAAQKALPQYTETEKAAQRGGISYWQPAPADSSAHTKPPYAVQLPPIAAPDSLPFIAVSRKPTFLDKLFGHTPKMTIYPGLLPVKAGKKSTVNIFHGPATVTTTTVGKKATAATAEGAVATVIEKKAGPAIVASDSSTQNAILGGGNIQATNGNNNTPQLTAPVQQAADWRATLAKPTGYVLAGLGTVLLVGGCIYLIAAYKRRNLLHNNG